MANQIDPETGCQTYDATHLDPATPSKYPPEAAEGLTLIADAIVVIGDEDGIWLSYDDPETDELMTHRFSFIDVARLSDAISNGANRWASVTGSFSVSRREATWKLAFGTFGTRRQENWWALLVSVETFTAMLEAFKLLASENS